MKIKWTFKYHLKHIRLDTPAPKIIVDKKHKKVKHKKDYKDESSS